MMDDLTPTEAEALADMGTHAQTGMGYSGQQSTRPQTLGYGLADSPAGQLAWIVEKFWAWTDGGGHPEGALTRQQMLDDVSTYWFTNTAASSARLYWESFTRLQAPSPIALPTGITIFPKEIIRPVAALGRAPLHRHCSGSRRSSGAATSPRSSSPPSSSTSCGAASDRSADQRPPGPNGAGTRRRRR